MSLLFQFIGVFIKTDKKLILFNGHSQKYNDSPRAIFEYILRNKKNEEYKYVWALDEPDKYDIPNCTKIKMDTVKYFYVTLKAGYWVSCVNIERGLRFKKRQTRYLNTWHGTPIKKVGNAVDGRKDFDFSNIDLFCYASDYEKQIYLRDFNVKKNSLIATGLPRNDELYDSQRDEVDKIKKMLGIKKGKKVILYAPTWRDSVDGGNSYIIKPPIDIAFWEDQLKDDYVLLLRTHAYTNKLMGIEFNDFVRDYTSYADINHLLKIADFLISDYSAVIFDYAILEKPIICFAYDYDDYVKERGLYIEIDKEIPGGILRTQEAVIEKIKNIDYQEECIKVRQFKEKYLKYGGDATRRSVEILFKNEMLRINKK